jgi:predicted aconitase
MDQTSGVVKVTEPLLVFGGPYSNLEATEALLEEARRRAVPPGNIVCPGDLVAYCADPQGVIDLLRNSGIRIVMGNCEESLAARAAECGCGFAEDSACAALSGQWYPYADRNVDTESRLWMGSLPRHSSLRWAVAGLSWCMAASPASIVSSSPLATTRSRRN